MQTLSPHMCPSAFTQGYMSLDKSLDMASDLRPSVKALLNVARGTCLDSDLIYHV